MNAVERAKEIMQTAEERRSIEEIARLVGMSAISFSRLFSALEGLGPRAYERRLRLERAADELKASPRKPLVDIALDAGFESQQTFTRAFTALFGLPPGAFRTTGRKESKKMTVNPIESKFDYPTVMNLPARRFAAVNVTIDGIAKAGPADAWATLMPKLPVPEQIPSVSYGICTAETAEGTHTYMAAVELQSDAPIPIGLTEVNLSAERYFVVRQWLPAKGFGDHLRAGLDRLWSSMLREHGAEPNGSPDIEVYQDDFHAGETDGWITYMVPLKA